MQESVTKKLLEISNLPHNWDGYNSSIFPRCQVDRAERLYIRICNYYESKGIDIETMTPFVAPCSGINGDILFDWCGDRFPDKELEVYIPKDKEVMIHYLKSDSEGELEGNTLENDLSELLDWLFGE